MGYVLLTSVISLVFLCAGYVMGRQISMDSCADADEYPTQINTDVLKPTVLSEFDEYQIEQKRKGVRVD